MKIAQKICPLIPFIFLSGSIDEESAIESLKSGAKDYVFKNQVKKLSSSIRRAINETQEIKKREEAEEEAKEGYEKLRKIFDEIVVAFSSLAEKRDPYTAGHQRNVAKLSCAIASEMNLPSDTIRCLNIAGLLHDIGKVHIPSEILNKPGKLSELEFNIIKTHPEVGYEILKGIEFPWPVAEIVFQHHEHIDGSGYPMHLSNEKILFEARIITIADVIEAMSSYRPYRPHWE